MNFTILLFTFGVSLTQAVVFDCIFQNVVFSVGGDVYSCFLPTITNTGSTLEIRGTHKVGKSNSDVEGFYINNQPLNEIPNGLNNFFPNLNVFFVVNLNLSSISSNDLQYPELLYFRALNSKLENIDGNLFENNPKLVYIDFELNQIKNVGNDLLTGLNDLEEIDFRNNPCINKRAMNPTEIQELNRLLPISCPPLVTTTTAKTTPTTTISTTTDSNVCSSGCFDQIKLVEDKLMQRIIELERQMLELTLSPCSCSK
jgi:hypothetical protein